MNSFVLFAYNKGKVSKIHQGSHGFPAEYELDLGCRETHRMEDQTCIDPYRVGRGSELKLFLAGAGVEVVNVGCCVTHHKFHVIGSDHEWDTHYACITLLGLISCIITQNQTCSKHNLDTGAAFTKSALAAIHICSTSLVSTLP
jgi:hypothetical protein